MYLYIFEDTSIRQSQDGPTDDDKYAIRDGILRVVTLVGGKFVEYTGFTGDNLPHLEDVEERRNGQADNTSEEGA